MFYNIPGRAVSTFDNPNVLGEYLIIVIPVVFAMLLVSQKASEKILFFSSFILCSCCLIFTWSRGAWLGFAFAVILFIVLKSHRAVAYVALFTPAILFALSFLLNRNMIDRISSIGNTADSSTLYRLNIWIGSVNMLKDTFLYGIGIGTEAFSSVYPMYALAGTETAPHTHSLYLQIISETGIFSLITFIILILSFISIVFSYLRYTSQKKARILPIGCFCGIMAFLVQGLTDYVWYNYRIYLLFWMMLGLSVAIIRLYTENERKKFLYV
jgi:O-antigen ligase